MEQEKGSPKFISDDFRLEQALTTLPESGRVQLIVDAFHEMNGAAISKIVPYLQKPLSLESRARLEPLPLRIAIAPNLDRGGVFEAEQILKIPAIDVNRIHQYAMLHHDPTEATYLMAAVKQPVHEASTAFVEMLLRHPKMDTNTTRSDGHSAATMLRHDDPFLRLIKNHKSFDPVQYDRQMLFFSALDASNDILTQQRIAQQDALREELATNRPTMSRARTLLGLKMEWPL